MNLLFFPCNITGEVSCHPDNKLLMGAFVHRSYIWVRISFALGPFTCSTPGTWLGWVGSSGCGKQGGVWHHPRVLCSAQTPRQLLGWGRWSWCKKHHASQICFVFINLMFLGFLQEVFMSEMKWKWTRVNEEGKATDFKHVASVDQPSLQQGFAENNSLPVSCAMD